MSKEFRRWLVVFGVLAALALVAFGVGVAPASANGNAGAVYTLSNAVSGNEVVAFDRRADGTLSPAGRYPTGGNGTGSGLGSQGALVLSNNNRWLFAVNAGSNSVSVFRVEPSGLTRTDVAASGGTRPISLTHNGSLLYVLNAGDASNLGANITGFRVAPNGTLSPIEGSTRPLSRATGTNPAQVGFTPDGDTLVVTEKDTNKIDTYEVGRDGIATGPTVYPSSGAVPFGFGFGKRGALIVSEAAGRAPLSAVSSYRVDDDQLKPVSPSVATEQRAACWIVVTGNGKYAYSANAASQSISTFRVGTDASLALLGNTATTGRPIDMALSNNSQYLYALAAGDGVINIFSVQANGDLVKVGDQSGMSAPFVGLAAR